MPKSRKPKNQKQSKWRAGLDASLSRANELYKEGYQSVELKTASAKNMPERSQKLRGFIEKYGEAWVAAAIKAKADGMEDLENRTRQRLLAVEEQLNREAEEKKKESEAFRDYAKIYMGNDNMSIEEAQAVTGLLKPKDDMYRAYDYAQKRAEERRKELEARKEADRKKVEEDLEKISKEQRRKQEEKAMEEFSRATARAYMERETGYYSSASPQYANTQPVTGYYSSQSYMDLPEAVRQAERNGAITRSARTLREEGAIPKKVQQKIDQVTDSKTTPKSRPTAGDRDILI